MDEANEAYSEAATAEDEARRAGKDKAKIAGLKRALEEADERSTRLQHEIAGAPATTLDGVEVKLRQAGRAT